MRIRYTSPALLEEAAILDYIRDRSPGGARNVSESIERALARVQRWPLSSEATDDGLIRRTVATPYPYYILYEPTETEIIVHRVRHTSRDPEAR